MIDADHAGGPDKNNCRTYTGPEDYGREFGGTKAPIAVMGPDINENIKKMVFTEVGATAMAKAGQARKEKLGDLKFYGSIWSPAPWVKVTSGGKIDLVLGFQVSYLLETTGRPDCRLSR